MLKVYIIGVCILIVAIIANALIAKIGLESWYSFIKLLQENGTNSFAELSLWDYLWLFLLYPLTLGFGYDMGERLYSFLF